MNSLDQLPEGRFRIDGPIGSGANADVSLAFDSSLNRKVALKQLRTEQLNSKAVSLILSEAQSWAQVNHPNIVAVFDVIRLDDRPTIVTEYIDGTSLRFALIENKWTLAERVQCLRAIVDALTALAEAGISHGDVRLENVLVSKSGSVKLTDFGLSQMGEDLSHTDARHLNGTLASIEDLTAFAQVFQEVIPEHLRTRLCEHILTSLGSDRDLSSLSEQLRLLHAESCQEDTPDTPVVTARPRNYVWAAAGALTLLIGLVLIWFERPTLPTHVVIDSTQLEKADGLPAEMQMGMKLMVQSALEQGVLADKRLLLLDSSEISENWVQMASDYDDVQLSRVTPVIECESRSCQIFFKHQSIDGQRAPQTTLSERVPFLGDGSRQLFEIAQHLFTSLPLGLADVSPKKELPMQALTRYNELHRSVNLDSADCQESMDEIDELKRELRDFPPIYRLGVYCGLEIFYVSGESDLAVRQTESLAAFVASRPEQSASLYGDLVKSSAERGEFDAAKEFLERAAVAKADWWSLSLWEADMLSYMGEYQQASELYESAVQGFPTRNAIISSAINYYYWGELESADRVIKKGVAAFPDDSRTLSLAGLVSLNLGDLEAARVHLTKALTGSKNLSYAANMALLHLLAGEPQAAEQLLRPYYEETGGDATVILNLADSLELQDRKEEAAVYYNELAALGGRQLHLYEITSKAQALAHLGRFSEAIRLVKQTRDRLGATSSVLYATATIYALADEPNSASAAILEASESGYHPVWFSFPWFTELCSLAFSEANIHEVLGCQDGLRMPSI
ncbi:MAG: protein kinase [Pseudomonadota bacterium]